MVRATRSVTEAVSLLRETPAGFVRVVATDADGTLWEGDVGDALFRHMAQRDAFSPDGRAAIAALCARLLGEVPTTVVAQADALIAGHSDGRVPIEALCDLEAQCSGERPRQEWDALLREVATVFASRMRDESVRLLHALRGEGYAVHVVTGSLAALVEATLAAAGVAADRVSGGVLLEAQGRVLPLLAGPIPLHGGKVEALRGAGHWPAAVGLGDGGWDASFLDGCALPLLVHPKPALLAAMKDHPRVARLSDVPL